MLYKLAMASCILLIAIFAWLENWFGIFFWGIIYTIIIFISLNK